MPAALALNNPYTADVATSANTKPSANTSVSPQVSEPTLAGLMVTNLSPGLVANTSIQGVGGATKRRTAKEPAGSGGSRGGEEPCAAGDGYSGHNCDRLDRHRRRDCDLGAAPIPVHLWLLGLQSWNGRSLHRRGGRNRSHRPGSAPQSYPERDLRSVLRPRRLPRHTDLLQHVDHRAVACVRSIQLSRAARNHL